MNANKHMGSTFDSFLEEEGLLEEAEAIAIKRIIAFELEKVMAEKKMNKTKMAEIIHTSRSQFDRLLDPSNTSVTLNTIVKASHAIGKRIKISLTDNIPMRKERKSTSKKHSLKRTGS